MSIPKTPDRLWAPQHHHHRRIRSNQTFSHATLLNRQAPSTKCRKFKQLRSLDAYVPESHLFNRSLILLLDMKWTPYEWDESIPSITIKCTCSVIFSNPNKLTIYFFSLDSVLWNLAISILVNTPLTNTTETWPKVNICKPCLLSRSERTQNLFPSSGCWS